jgi:hypothetical protein
VSEHPESELAALRVELQDWRQKAEHSRAALRDLVAAADELGLDFEGMDAARAVLVEGADGLADQNWCKRP